MNLIEELLKNSSILRDYVVVDSYDNTMHLIIYHRDIEYTFVINKHDDSHYNINGALTAIESRVMYFVHGDKNFDEIVKKYSYYDDIEQSNIVPVLELWLNTNPIYNTIDVAKAKFDEIERLDIIEKTILKKMISDSLED